MQKKKVIIYPLAFTIDNSETEFELDIEYRELSEELGFETYKVAKAPNDNTSFVKCIHSLYELKRFPLQIQTQWNNSPHPLSFSGNTRASLDLNS